MITTAERLPETVPPQAEYLGTLTARQDMGVDFAEPGYLKYLGVPLHVFRTEQDDASTRFDAAVQHRPLDATLLLGFLKTVAPDGQFDNRKGVLDDWERLDPQRTRNHLAPLHERLKEPWEEFMRSRAAFASVMRGVDTPEFGRRGWNRHAPYLFQPGRMKPKIPQSFIELESVEAVSERLRPGFGIDAERLLYEGIKRFTKVKSPVSQQTKPELARRYSSLRPEDKAALLGSMVNKLSRRSRPIYDENAEQDGGCNIVVEITGRSIIYADTVRYETQLVWPLNLAKAYEERKMVRNGAHECEMLDLEYRVGKDAYGVEPLQVPRSLRQISDPSLIEPIIAWTVDAQGKRAFIEDHRGDPTTTNRFRDSSLGVLAVAYMAPEVRAQWPKAMPIGRTREQPMGSAQVPVMALFPGNQQKLLKSPLITTAEKLA